MVRYIKSKWLLLLLLQLFWQMPASKCQNISWEALPQLRFAINYGPYFFFVDSTDTTLFAMGEVRFVNNQYHPGLVRLNRDFSIKPFNSPIKPGRRHCAIRWNNKLYVGGVNGLDVYDGITWATIDSNNAVNILFEYNGKLLIGGIFYDTTQILAKKSRVLVEYDGTTFKRFQNLDSFMRTGAEITCIKEYKGKLYVGGNFENINTPHPEIKEIICWNGSNWEDVGGGIQGSGNDWVTDMEVMNDTLYVSGWFEQSLGGPGNGIAAFDGSSWHNLGDGVQIEYVSDIETRGSRLYACGNFQTVDNQPTQYFAIYESGKWYYNSAVIDMPTGDVIDFFGDLIVCGGFYSIDGDTAARYIARVKSESTVGDPELPDKVAQKLGIYPNPAVRQIMLDIPSRKFQLARVLIYNAMGQMIYEQDAILYSGNNKIEVPIGNLPAGNYFVTVNGESQQCHGSFLKE